MRPPAGRGRPELSATERSAWWLRSGLMRLREVLTAYLENWEDIEARLYVVELERVAAVHREDSAELEWLSYSLPAFLGDTVQRESPFDPYSLLDPGEIEATQVESLLGQLRARADEALATDSIALDRLADRLEGVAVDDLSWRLRQLTDVDVLGGSHDPTRAPWAAFIGSAADALDYASDPMGVLSWWFTPNSWLGQAPSQAARFGRDDEVQFAARLSANDSW
jgi:hypothetical protein